MACAPRILLILYSSCITVIRVSYVFYIHSDRTRTRSPTLRDRAARTLGQPAVLLAFASRREPNPAREADLDMRALARTGHFLQFADSGWLVLNSFGGLERKGRSRAAFDVRALLSAHGWLLIPY
eukprot:3187165-Pleurochrysis_carterae.AAC.4